MNEKREKTEPVHINNILSQILKGLCKETDTQLMQIWTDWEKIVGKQIAQNTHPVGFKGKLVFVNVVSSIWLHQLQFMKQDIIQKINDSLGQDFVEDIKFNVGEI